MESSEGMVLIGSSGLSLGLRCVSRMALELNSLGLEGGMDRFCFFDDDCPKGNGTQGTKSRETLPEVSNLFQDISDIAFVCPLGDSNPLPNLHIICKFQGCRLFSKVNLLTKDSLIFLLNNSTGKF